MPHGYPDGGHDTSQSTVKLVDMGELAKRLGAVSTYDRSGNIVFFDDGDAGLTPYEHVAPVDAEWYRMVDGRFVSNSAIVLPVVTAYIPTNEIMLKLPCAVQHKVGMEFTFFQTPLVDTEYAWLWIEIDLTKDGTYMKVKLRLDFTADRIQLGTFDGGVEQWTWVTDAGSDPYPLVNDDVLYNIKIVCDTDDHYVSYFTLNGKLWDLGTYTIPYGVSPYANSFIAFIAYHSEKSTCVMKVSDLIITDNEVERK